MKWKSELARCRVSKALRSITRRETPRCATTKPYSTSPISRYSRTNAGSSPQATDNRTKWCRTGLRPQPQPQSRNHTRTRLLPYPRRPLQQVAEKATKRRRARRRQHSLPRTRNLPQALPPPLRHQYRPLLQPTNTRTMRSRGRLARLPLGYGIPLPAKTRARRSRAYRLQRPQPMRRKLPQARPPLSRNPRRALPQSPATRATRATRRQADRPPCLPTCRQQTSARRHTGQHRWLCEGPTSAAGMEISRYKSSALKAIENSASATITRKIDCTTLRVVWRPT